MIDRVALRRGVIAALALSSGCQTVFGLEEPALVDALALDTADASPADSDNDGINDAADNCPALSNANQRNWDNDSRGDACDGCPHLISTTHPDADADGIGDECDPRSGRIDQRVLWLGFYDAADIDGWINRGGMWTAGGGRLDQSATVYAELDSPLTYSGTHFAIRLQVLQPNTPAIGFCAASIWGSVQHACCEIENPNGVAAARVVVKSGGDTGGGTAQFTGSANPGDVIDLIGTQTAGQFTCTFRQGLTAATSSVDMTGALAGAAAFYAYTPVRFHYAFVVKLGN